MHVVDSPTDVKKASRNNFDPFQRAVIMFATMAFARTGVVVDHKGQNTDIDWGLHSRSRKIFYNAIDQQPSEHRLIENEAFLKAIHQSEDSGRSAV